MPAAQLNRLAGNTSIALALCALLLVAIGFTQPPQPPPQDEGALAHLFQLSVVLLVPALVVCIATADWRRPLRSARPIAIAVATTVVAFVALFYLESRP